jgi:hypothetical protein
MRRIEKQSKEIYDMTDRPMLGNVCAICEKEMGTYEFRGRKICAHCLSIIRQ